LIIAGVVVVVLVVTTVTLLAVRKCRKNKKRRPMIEDDLFPQPPDYYPEGGFVIPDDNEVSIRENQSEKAKVEDQSSLVFSH